MLERYNMGLSTEGPNMYNCLALGAHAAVPLKQTSHLFLPTLFYVSRFHSGKEKKLASSLVPLSH
jgi:hypothetical protein